MFCTVRYLAFDSRSDADVNDFRTMKRANLSYYKISSEQATVLER